jgi:hypothetical protein
MSSLRPLNGSVNFRSAYEELLCHSRIGRPPWPKFKELYYNYNVLGLKVHWEIIHSPFANSK